jgi:hypothetical protein
MANTKIAGLAAISTIATDDELPIVDTSETATKKITVAQLTGQFTAPYLQQSDLTDQAIANNTLAQVITFNTDDYHEGITRTSSSRFTISTAGAYLITFSAVVACADAVAGKILNIWMRVDGVDVANSNTYYTFKGISSNTVLTVTFIYKFTAGQYFELWMWGDDTDVSLNATPAAGSPTRPACPSIILTCNRISN